jgi:hypothetical protein
MRRAWRGVWALAGLGVLGVVAPSTAGADEAPVPLSRVPAAVVQAARQAAPGVRLSKALKTVEEGTTYYDLIGQDDRGREVDVELTARGQVLGVGTEIPWNEVPRAVVAALRAKGRGIKFTDAEAVTLNGRLIAYRFEGETAQGDDVEATVTPDGRSVEIEVDDD